MDAGGVTIEAQISLDLTLDSPKGIIKLEKG